MPATVLAFPSRTQEEFCILDLALPGASRTAIGVFLFDSVSGRLQFRLREDWDDVSVDEDDLELLECLARDFAGKIGEMGGAAFLDSLEDTLSNFLMLSPREAAAGADLDDLFETHVDRRVHPFVTHLPVYSLQAAATKFGEDSEVEAVGWRRVSGLRLAEGMFIARVVGRSMEPLIPDNSFCVFRAPVAGSRQGKRLLIEMFGTTDSSARYTVKRYTSRKSESESGEWEHAAIRLEPLNREFPAFELEEGQFRVIGEFVQVLP